MKILLIGEHGQVSWELLRTLAPLGEIYATDYPHIDLADEGGTRQLVRRVQPNVIVNAAAYTAVDRAESETELAHAINGTAPGVLAEEARALGAALVHYSTDFVFDGTKGEAYVETDQPNPINAYGRTKLAGEQAIEAVGGAYLILRTSWVYSMRRPSFVTKALEWARKNPTLRIVTDQVGSPTWARMLAEITAQALAMGGAHAAPWLGERSGVYHLGGNGAASRFEWAKAILANDPNPAEQVVQAVLPATSTDFPTPALRPEYSPLNCDKFSQLFSLRLPPWEAALKMAMNE